MNYLSTKTEFEPFDYAKSKEAFIRLQHKYIQKKSQGIIEGKVNLWTREKVEIYIDIILDYKKKNESYQDDEEMAKYDVVKINGVYKLVLKRKYRGQRVEVVPFEDCFDKILLIHRRLGHNKSLNKMMYKVLSKKYVIDKIWVFLIHRSCNFCKTNMQIGFDYWEGAESCLQILANTPLAPRFNRCHQIVITHPTNMNGNEFSQEKMLMIVVDRLTQFVFLRPLQKFDESHVTVELVKIYTDFGFPRLIETRKMGVFENVVKMLPKFNKEYKIHLINMPFKKNPIWCSRVLAYIKEWMDVNDCDDWVSACPVVQWQMNTIRGPNNSSPYKDVFNMEPVKDLIVG